MMRERLPVAAIALAVVFLPVVLGGGRTAQFGVAGAYVIVISGLQLLGSSGHVSLGHGALMALGGYTTAILVADHGVRDLWTIPIAGAVGALGALAVGLPVLRLDGRYLALTTLGLALVLPQVALRFDHFSHGADGITFFGRAAQTGRGSGVDVLGVQLSNDTWQYALAWIGAAVLAAVAWRVRGSRLGRALRALGDSERDARAFGVNRVTAPLAALALSGLSAGVAGALLAGNYAYVSPSTFPVALSVALLVGAAFAGRLGLPGAVAGALAIEFLPGLAGALPHVDASRTGLRPVVFGVALIAVTLLLPLRRRLGEVLARRR